MANRERRPNESFKDYRLELAIEYLNDKMLRRGTYFHISKAIRPDGLLGHGHTYERGINKTKRKKRHAV